MRRALHTSTINVLALVLSMPLVAQDAVDVRLLDGKETSIALSGMTRYEEHASRWVRQVARIEIRDAR